MCQFVWTALNQAERFLKLVFRTGVVETAIGDVGNEVSGTFEVGSDMGAEQYRMLAILNVGMQDIHEFVAGKHIESAGRLVENQQLGIMTQCDGEHQLHLHAAGKILDMFLAVLCVTKAKSIQILVIASTVP